jgi:hypothetical protein
LGKGFFGHPVKLEDLRDKRHPEVVLIPRNQLLDVRDQWDDHIAVIGIDCYPMPFSSYNFFVDEELDYYSETEHKTVFREFMGAQAFFRLGSISQLGYLVPPPPEGHKENDRVYYLPPMFPHTRWLHSMLTACLMEVVLARNGFSAEERTPMVLAAAFHDIATPVGGDSVKRVSPTELDEEKNFSWILKYYKLDKRWKEMFGFKVRDAAKWVQGLGLFGQLLDWVDKISYTAVDCLYIGNHKETKIRQFACQHSLVMDIWQDIRFSEDRKQIYFSDRDRLFDYLYLRALEHEELLLNPRARSLDFLHTKLVKKLYDKGIKAGSLRLLTRRKRITKKELITKGGFWFEDVLQKNFPKNYWGPLVTPDDLVWKRFKTEEEMLIFCRSLGKKHVDHYEEIKPFKTGLDWPVKFGKSIRRLRDVLPNYKKRRMNRILEKTTGYYVYFMKGDQKE